MIRVKRLNEAVLPDSAIAGRASYQSWIHIWQPQISFNDKCTVCIDPASMDVAKVLDVIVAS